MYHVELVSFPQWVQTTVPDVQAKNHKDMKVMIPVVVDTATNLIFLIKRNIFLFKFSMNSDWFARQVVFCELVALVASRKANR